MTTEAFVDKVDREAYLRIYLKLLPPLAPSVHLVALWKSRVSRYRFFLLRVIDEGKSSLDFWRLSFGRLQTPNVALTCSSYLMYLLSIDQVFNCVRMNYASLSFVDDAHI